VHGLPDRFDADQTTLQFGYDSSGRRTSVTDQNGKVTQYA
jgi:YD repeat-containing protein